MRPIQIGQASATIEERRVTLINRPTPADIYSDAQISDYDRAADFRWHPSVRLTVTARMSPGAEQVRGTAGFGFWNQPFMPGQWRLRLPQAIWFFFSSPPSDMRLAKGVRGPGWKAATIDAKRWQFLALAPFALPGCLLMRIPALYNRLWPVGQSAIGVSEALLDQGLLAETHTYTLEWQPDGATFRVDGRVTHEAPVAPGGPLGFIAWIDNQYAVVTPQGRFRSGLLPLTQPQTLILDTLSIE